jgi:pimeloyl-ACP methyl ester carboxylesterase
MRVTDTLPTLPAIIEAIAGGDLGLLEVQAEQGIAAVGTPMKGMFLSMECADAARFSDPNTDVKRVLATSSPFTSLVQYTAQAFCKDWKVKPLPDAFSRPVKSKIPALVMAGSLDPVTPASDSKRTAKKLRNAQYIEFENFGHGVTIGTDCPRQVRQVFLDDPEAELDLACIDDPSPTFLSQGLI